MSEQLGDLLGSPSQPTAEIKWHGGEGGVPEMTGPTRLSVHQELAIKATSQSSARTCCRLTFAQIYIKNLNVRQKRGNVFACVYGDGEDIVRVLDDV